MGHLNNAKLQEGKSHEGCTLRLHTSRSHNGKSFTTKRNYQRIANIMNAHKKSNTLVDTVPFTYTKPTTRTSKTSALWLVNKTIHPIKNSRLCFVFLSLAGALILTNQKALVFKNAWWALCTRGVPQYFTEVRKKSLKVHHENLAKRFCVLLYLN